MWANSKDAETQKKHLTQQPHVKNQIPESLTPAAGSRIRLRDNCLSTASSKSYEDILDYCCFAWNKLIDMLWKIMYIGTTD